MAEGEKEKEKEPHDEYGIGLTHGERREPLIGVLNAIARIAVRVLAVLMVFVIVWGVLDVIWILYQRLSAQPLYLLSISDILQTFGGFLAVLIAIEIFFNIVLYLRESAIHVKLVLATALMAIARKVIVFDFSDLGSEYVWATAAVILALGVSYWLVSRIGGSRLE